MKVSLSEKVKVVRIIARLNIGGPAIHTILLSSELDRIGYKTILVKGLEGGQEGDMMYLADSKGVKPVLVPELGREIGFKNDLVAFYKLYKLIKKEKPDIVHTHTAKAGTLGRLAAWLAGVPVIIHTFHGHVLAGYFGGLKSWIFIQIEKMLAYISTKIITLSDELKEELIGMGIGKEKKFEVISLGLELKPFLEIGGFIPSPSPLPQGEGVRGRVGEFKKELGLSEDTILVGIVGRLVPIKGHRYFLETAKIINSKFEIRNSKFVIVGDGELREELEDYAKRLGIADNVIFTGFRDDLVKIYADLDIVALTSLNEGTPVSIIEAMAAGLPVVAAIVGGVPALVKDGITGFLVPPKRGDLFAEAVMKLLNDPDLRKRFGEEARRNVFPRYDISQLIKRMDSLYASLTKSPHP